MPKELPYFKFEPAEYLTKDISFCSLEAQGLFINLCCYYWQRECNLSESQFLRRFPNETLFKELINEGVIDIYEDLIRIKFLDTQLQETIKKSIINSNNGSKGGRPKKRNKTENKAKQNRNKTETKSETKGIREDKIREDNINIPTLKDFIAYAVENKPKVNTQSVKLKYESWVVNDWKDGNNKPIKNWKSKLLNTLPYIDESESGKVKPKHGMLLN